MNPTQVRGQHIEAVRANSTLQQRCSVQDCLRTGMMQGKSARTASQRTCGPTPLTTNVGDIGLVSKAATLLSPIVLPVDSCPSVETSPTISGSHAERLRSSPLRPRYGTRSMLQANLTNLLSLTRTASSSSKPLPRLPQSGGAGVPIAATKALPGLPPH